ncbi:MAG TPA: class I SAM-dependent methyltransferase [Rhizomicrobium sp.]
MRPTGLRGRIFGHLMEWLAAPNYHWVIRQLRSVRPRSYLEIGFGTGRLAQLAAERFMPRRIYGVDPSNLMLRTALKKLSRFDGKTALHLRLGDDALLKTWPDGPFDAVVAAHSWQFWRNPVATLLRVRSLLAPQGRFVLVVRRHILGDAAKWIPNPVTMSGDELGGLRAALAAAGFRIVTDETLSSGSRGIVAVCA